MIFWGAPLLILYGALFLANGLTIGWKTAYDVTLAIESPGDVTSIHSTFWAWPLSIAGWLAVPGLAGAIAGYAVSSSIDRRRSSNIREKYTFSDGLGARRRRLALDLIPLLKDLISKENDFGLSYEFVPRFVYLAHVNNYRQAQDHWERYVSDMLDTDLPKRHETGLSAMHHAVKGAAASLMTAPWQDRCPICGVPGGSSVRDDPATGQIESEEPDGHGDDHSGEKIREPAKAAEGEGTNGER